MVFNLDKCNVMHVGNWEDSRTYYVEDRELSVVSCEKDLGVWISADMKCSKQCTIIISDCWWRHNNSL